LARVGTRIQVISLDPIFAFNFPKKSLDEKDARLIFSLYENNLAFAIPTTPEHQ
jgi:hypothetical protein